MATCPKGHTSVATDYCDECGAPIAGATPPPESPPSTVEEVPAETGAGEVCPECHTARDGRFCEVCGHDFLAESASAPASPPSTPTSTPAAESPSPDGSPSPGGTPPPDGTGPAWRVSVIADRAYHDFMDAERAEDADPVPFPAYCPERRFPLAGTEMLIGRRSRSRGIEPAVDLTGPPEDPGISHMHALLVATKDGWNLVDLDSANGTYLNEGRDPIRPNEPVALSVGDQIHVGAWTTLTIQPA